MLEVHPTAVSQPLMVRVYRSDGELARDSEAVRLEAFNKTSTSRLVPSDQRDAPHCHLKLRSGVS